MQYHIQMGVLGAPKNRKTPYFWGSYSFNPRNTSNAGGGSWASQTRATRTGQDAATSAPGGKQSYLTELGTVVGGEFSAEFMAKPNGEEIWAAIRLLDVSGSVRFRYATTAHKSPDFLIGGGIMLEVKTPQSVRKIAKRLLEISEQFEGYPDEPKVGVLSLLNLDVDISDAIDIAQRFVDDGTLDTVYVIPKSGEIRRVER